jgi:molybdenum cofactor cytidylyltransferase
MTRLGAILLAAGASSRMRRPKLLLPWGDLSAADTVIGQSLRAVLGAPVAWIGLVTGAAGAAIARRARVTYRLWPQLPGRERPFLRVIHNPSWESGLRSSIVAGVKLAPPHLDGLFIALGDMPAVPTAAYNRLAEAFGADPNRIYRAAYQGVGGHPVLFPRSLLTGIQPEGDEGLRSLLVQHARRVTLVDVGDSGALLDLDTPEAYRTALRRLRMGPALVDETDGRT